MKINKKYCLIFLGVFFIEVMIALYVRDQFIRPFVGDVLVMVLMYSFIRIFLTKGAKYLPIYLFGFAALVEGAQYFHLVERLHLQEYRILSIIIGTTFDMKDMACYFVGTMILVGWQVIESRKRQV